MNQVLNEDAAPRARRQPAWGRRLDTVCLFFGAILPLGLVLGNVVFETSVAATGAFWLVRAAVLRENPLGKVAYHPLVLPWAAWYGVVVLALVVNGAGNKGFGHDLAMLRYLLFGLALFDVGTRRPVGRYLVYGLTAAVAAGAANALSARFLGSDLVGRPWEEYQYKESVTLGIGGIAAYAGPFFFGWAILAKGLAKKQRAWLLALTFLALALLFLIKSRTAIMASFGGIGLVLLYGQIAGRRTLWGWALMGLFVAVGVGIILRYEQLHSLRSFYDRIYIWKVSFGVFYDNPLLGCGVSSFRSAYTQVAASGVVEPFTAPNGQVFAAPTQTHAHNIVLMLLACTGVLGLAAFTWLFVRAVKVVFNHPAGFRLGLVSFPAVLCVAGLTGYNIYYSWYQALVSFFLVLIGLAAVPGDTEGSGSP